MRTALLLLLGIYVAAYLVLRFTQAEVWQADGQTYVIFPRDAAIVWYLFRPISYADAFLTGMRFHIGPHQ